jgi:hypothetical protein
MKNTDKAQEAFKLWQYLAFKNADTDYLINKLLEEIAGTEYYELDEIDPYEIIQTLDEEQLDAFLDGGSEIIKKL